MTIGVKAMFIDPTEFPFIAPLEANWRIVRDELERLSRDNFMAWPDKFLYGQPEQQRFGNGWEVFGLYAFCRKLAKNCSYCPGTTSLVEQVPGITTAGFSALQPGTHIKPHVGYTNTVLRCHLGLIVPEECALRVGHETKTWQEGKCMVFDDTTEHEAWNRSSTSRVVLIIDFTRPGAAFTPPAEAVQARMQEADQPA
jgi:beta-hydroxylase